MRVQDTASAILKRLEEGTQAIYDQYQAKAVEADASYKQKLSDLDRDYREASRALSGASRVGLQDRLTGLADLGLASSGAAQQARVSAQTALLGALGKLSARHSGIVPPPKRLTNPKKPPSPRKARKRRKSTGTP